MPPLGPGSLETFPNAIEQADRERAHQLLSEAWDLVMSIVPPEEWSSHQIATTRYQGEGQSEGEVTEAYLRHDSVYVYLFTEVKDANGHYVSKSQINHGGFRKDIRGAFQGDEYAGRTPSERVQVAEIVLDTIRLLVPQPESST